MRCSVRVARRSRLSIPALLGLPWWETIARGDIALIDALAAMRHVSTKLAAWTPTRTVLDLDRRAPTAPPWRCPLARQSVRTAIGHGPLSVKHVP